MINLFLTSYQQISYLLANESNTALICFTASSHMLIRHVLKLLGREVVSRGKWQQKMHTKHESQKGTQLHSTFDLDPGQQLRSITHCYNP